MAYKKHTLAHKLANSRAELMAVLVATLVTPSGSECEILTDSANVISILSNQTTTLHRWNKKANPHITQAILEIVQRKQLHIKYTKVAAHTGNRGNEIADKLAKIKEPFNPCGIRIIEVNPENFYQIAWTFTWNNKHIDQPINKFTKQMNKAKWHAKWRTQNRTNKWLNKTIAEKTDWKTSWSLAHPSKITKDITSRADHRSRIFNFKVLNDELPTKTRLFQRLPEIYMDELCPNCSNKEDSIHAIVCTDNNKLLLSTFIASLAKATSSRAAKKSTQKISEMLDKVLTSEGWDIDNLLRRTIPHKLTQAVRKIVEDTHKTLEALRIACDALQEQARILWKERCENFILWERSVGITKKDKRIKSKNPNRTNIWDLIPIETHNNIVNRWIHSYIDNGTHIFKIYNFNINTNGVLTR
jgi:hypothetical protein